MIMTIQHRIPFTIALLICCGVAFTQTPEKLSFKEQLIIIKTSNTALVLQAASDGRLYQKGYGRVKPVSKGRTPAREDECYPPAGNGIINEPALHVIHADGNTSTDLVVKGIDSVKIDANITHT